VHLLSLCAKQLLRIKLHLRLLPACISSELAFDTALPMIYINGFYIIQAAERTASAPQVALPGGGMIFAMPAAAAVAWMLEM
jgi:hypothetical protein